MKLEKRMEIERRLVRKLIREAKAAGWVVAYVFDGEERVKARLESEVIDAVFSVDDSVIHFRRLRMVNGAASIVNGWARIVLGNDGWDAIADNSIGPFNDEVVEKLSDYIDKLEAEVA